MTLRSSGRETVAMTGPRSRAVGAPQEIGNRGFAPGAGWEVSRIWSVRLGRVIAVPKKSTARRCDGPHRQRFQTITRAPAGCPKSSLKGIIAILRVETMASAPWLAWRMLDPKGRFHDKSHQTGETPLRDKA